MGRSYNLTFMLVSSERAWNIYFIDISTHFMNEKQQDVPMTTPITIEVIGFSDSTCGPFPCDSERTCELQTCHPTEQLIPAFKALKEKIIRKYGDSVTMELTLLDDTVPDRIKHIIEEYHPPIPIVLIAGKVTPLGRISYPLFVKEIEKIGSTV